MAYLRNLAMRRLLDASPEAIEKLEESICEALRVFDAGAVWRLCERRLKLDAIYPALGPAERETLAKLVAAGRQAEKGNYNLADAPSEDS